MRVAFLPICSIALALALFGAGCGSGERSYGGKNTTEAPPAESSTTKPKAPPGASAQSCASDSAAVRQLRVTGVSCAKGTSAARAWSRSAGCATRPGGSRGGCTVEGFRCISTSTERGVAVSCAGPGRSIAFTAKRG